jgi:putative transposase
MIINKAFKFRIYPSKEQKTLLEQHFGANRFVFNYFLNERKEYYLKNKEDIEAKRVSGNLNYYDNAKALTKLKQQEEYNWLNNLNSQSLQATLKDLETAYKHFFKKKAYFPRFKSKKHNHNSFRIPQNVKIEDNKLVIPKFKEGIKLKKHRDVNGRMVNATISKNVINQYYVSIIVECEVQSLDKLQKAVGIDLGIKDFAICSDGVIYENHKYLSKKEKQLKRQQRKLSKKAKGSQNRSKQKLKVAKIHNTIKNQRIDKLHKISTRLIKENQFICLEDLAVKNLVKNHKLAKSISDVSWSTFTTMLEYKAKWYGREVIKIDRFFPSSKTCNKCGYINQDLTLKVREWTCQECNTKHDRDLNASINILKQGLNKIADGTAVNSLLELPSLEGALNQEAHKSLACE